MKRWSVLALGPVLSACILLARAAHGQEGNAAKAAPTRTGSFGLLTMPTAEVGSPGRLAFAVDASFTEAVGLLVLGERNTRADAALALSFTPHRNVELFGAVSGFGDRESASPGLSGGTATSDRTGGDLLLGTKAATPLGTRFVPGLELGIKAPAGLTGLPSALSAWATLLASLDLTPPNRTPLRAHASVGYYRDGSRARIDFTGLPATTRQVLMYAYGVSDDRVQVALGLDAAIRIPRRHVTLQPLVEYHLEVITAGPDPAFSDSLPSNRDQHWVAVGLRAHVGPAFAFELGTEVALRSVGYPFGPPLAPYRILAGAAFDLR